jgi:transposase
MMSVKSPLSTSDKLGLLRRLEGGERVSAVAIEAGVLRKSLYEWKAAYKAFGAAGLNRKRGPKHGGGGRAAAAPSSSPDAVAAAARPPDTGPPDSRPPDELARAQARIGELERLVGRQQVDLDFFRKALRSWEDKRRVSDAPICSPSSKQ